MKNKKNYKKDEKGQSKGQGFLSMEDIAKIQEQIKKDQMKKRRYKRDEGINF